MAGTSEDQLNSTMYGNLRKLINVVDELRDVGLQQYINLPRICVVGTQSSGKSSVLESIMGLDFLPRGEGVVTRRPIELRLVHLSELEYKLDDGWVVFENEKGKKYADFEEVRGRINYLTDQVAGQNRGIIDEPLVLTVYATRCPDLTLIDLPGITRVPLKGSDQNDDIEKLTRNMAARYAEDPRTIILAVLPANADMSTSDALQLARKVDPTGVRTIGVITKLDLMDRGNDASRMLQGEDVPLRLGYTGLINRSQADIREGKTIPQAVQDEAAFFAKHPIYRRLPSGLYGIRALVEKLTKVLFRHIKSFLPDIKAEINNRCRIVQSRLSSLGGGVPTEAGERVQLMWTLVTDYSEIFKNIIRGKYDSRLQLYFQHEDISGGDKMRTIFNELLEDFVDKKITRKLSNYDIDLAIRMHEGDALPGFPSADTFEFLVLPHLQKIEAPVMDCLDRASQYLDFLSQKVAQRVFGRFPLLAEQVLVLSEEILQREKENTKKVLDNLVQLNSGYLFTNDEVYLSFHGFMISAAKDNKNCEPPQPEDPTQKSIEKAKNLFDSAKGAVTHMWHAEDTRKTKYGEPFLDEIRQRIESYFGLVLRGIRDSVPRTIGFFLMRKMIDNLQFELYNSLNDEARFSEWLGEPPHIKEERDNLSRQLGILKKAISVLQRDQRIASMSVQTIDDSFDADLRDAQTPCKNYSSQPSTLHSANNSSLNSAQNSAKNSAPSSTKNSAQNLEPNKTDMCGGEPIVRTNSQKYPKKNVTQNHTTNNHKNQETTPSNQNEPAPKSFVQKVSSGGLFAETNKPRSLFDQAKRAVVSNPLFNE